MTENRPQTVTLLTKAHIHTHTTWDTNTHKTASSIKQAAKPLGLHDHM